MSQPVSLAAIQAELQRSGLDGWLLYDFRGTNPVALYLAGLASSGSRRWFLWVPAHGEPRWLIHAIEGSTFRSVSPTFAGPMEKYVGWRDLAEALPRLVGANEDASLRIAMEYSPANAIPYVSRVDAGTKEFIEEATGAQIVSSADLVQLAQAVLSDAQQESHRRAAATCLAIKDAAFDHLRANLRSGTPMTEYTVQQFIAARFAEAGYETEHDALVAVNAHAADPHYGPTAETALPIRPGDMVLIDLWGRERGDPLACFADITWTGYCGAQVPPAAAEVFAQVAAGRDAAVAYIERSLAAGETVFGYAVDDACRDVIAHAGYGPAFFHRTGHSLGTAVHFNGVNIDNLETQDRRSLIPGVMFTIEPGIYQPSLRFAGEDGPLGLGIRSEINAIVQPGRLEVTTRPLQTAILPLT
jgi:Xaa-Pro aminopeptidase